MRYLSLIFLTSLLHSAALAEEKPNLFFAKEIKIGSVVWKVLGERHSDTKPITCKALMKYAASRCLPT